MGRAKILFSATIPPAAFLFPIVDVSLDPTSLHLNDSWFSFGTGSSANWPESSRVSTETDPCTG